MTKLKYLAATALIAGLLSACGGGDAGVDGASAGSGNGTFTLVAAMSTPRAEPCSVLLPDGRVMIAGGDRPANVSTTTEIFDPTTRRWSAAAPMSTPRRAYLGERGNCLIRLSTGKILALGGAPELYDPATDTWAATGTPTGPDILGTVTTLADERVLVIQDSSTTAEIYDPADGTWSEVAGFDGRYSHSATLLKNGKVLVSGGVGGNGASASSTTALLFDPGARSWTRTGDLHVGRIEHLSATLADGRVIASHGGTPLSTARISSETYDPSTGTWTLAGAILKDDPKTIGASGTFLEDGRFLVAGGSGSNEMPVLDGIPQGSLDETNAEAFRPSDSTWQRVSPAGTGLKTPRSYHAAVRLTDGTVLLAGGYDDQGLGIASAEIFTP